MFHFRNGGEYLCLHPACRCTGINILTNSAYVNTVLFQCIHIQYYFIEVASKSIHGITNNHITLTDCFRQINPTITIKIGSGFARVLKDAFFFHTSIH